MQSPRRHHYDFAHRLLPQLVRTEPDRLIDTLASENGEEFLRYLWRVTEERLQPADRLPFGLTRTIARLPSGQIAVVLGMPAPEAVTEAHLVAVVSGPERIVRYFTLEHGITFPEEHPRTVFCEWTDTSHLNYGDGPAPEIPAFLDHIEAHMAPRQ